MTRINCRRVRPVLSGLAAVAVLLPSSLQASQSRQSGSAEAQKTRYYHCSYAIRPDSFWTSVATTEPYDALVEQWKAFAKAKGGTSPYCFSRYRKDDSPYQSVEEVEAIGRLSADAKRIDWSPKRSGGRASARAANEGAKARAAASQSGGELRTDNRSTTAAPKYIEVAGPDGPMRLSPEVMARNKASAAEYRRKLNEHAEAVAKAKSEYERSATQHAQSVAKAAAERQEFERRLAAHAAELAAHKIAVDNAASASTDDDPNR